MTKKRKGKSPLELFQERLAGWMTDPDGFDHCPSCWKEWLGKFGPEHRGLILEDAESTGKKHIAERRKCFEGFGVVCEGVSSNPIAFSEGCAESVVVPTAPSVP